MMNGDRNSQGFIPLENTTTAMSNLTIPEKAALSNVTTVCASDKTPRTSKDSFAPSIRSNPFDTDLEANPITAQESGYSTHGSTPGRTGGMGGNGKNDCQVWPGKDHWKQKAKTAKLGRSCAFMAKMSKRNRIIAKIVIILLIIGIGVGVGFGVSKPLGAPIWGDDN